MRELGKNLPTSSLTYSPAPVSLYNSPPPHSAFPTSPSYPSPTHAPLAPPQLNTSPTRYRTVMHSPPAPSPPSLYPSPPHQSQAQSQSQTQARTRSPVRATPGSGVSVHAQPIYESDFLNWRHKSPTRYALPAILLFNNANLK